MEKDSGLPFFELWLHGSFLVPLGILESAADD